jgi:hypothetical protein
MVTIITFFGYYICKKGYKNFKMIIILEKEKITEKVKHKLLKKGLSLIGMSDKDIIFNKLKPHLRSKLNN